MELLGLSSVTYDVCPSGCMLYYGDDAGLESCKFLPSSALQDNCKAKRNHTQAGEKDVLLSYRGEIDEIV